MYNIPPGGPVRPPPPLYQHARVRKAFTSQHPSELSVALGDRVEILTDGLHGWSYVSNSAGYHGYVPSVYLEMEPEEEKKE